MTVVTNINRNQDAQGIKKFFLMWTIFKVFTEFATILFLFYVSVSWPGGM